LIRYVISALVALLSLVLVLLFMAQLIQPNVTATPFSDKLTPIDFFRTSPISDPHNQTSKETKKEIIPKEAPTPLPPVTQEFVILQNTPILESEAISLPKAIFSTLAPLQYLSYNADPNQAPSQALPNQQPNHLAREFSAQFTENLFPLHTPDPLFPRRARKRGIEGWVKTGFIIQPDGSVSGIQILDSEPTGIFDSITRKTVAKWKYKPQLLNGKPAAREVEKTIRFNLQK
jgi:protein TonB